MKRRKNILPAIPLRDVVLFPGERLLLHIGREHSVQALLLAKKQYNDGILLLTQKDLDTEEPTPSNIFLYGCVGRILKMENHARKNAYAVAIEALQRAQIKKFGINSQQAFEAEYTLMREKTLNKIEAEVLDTKKLLQLMERFIQTDERIQESGQRVLVKLRQEQDIVRMMDHITSLMPFSCKDKVAILSERNISQRYEKLIGLLNDKISHTEIDQRIRDRIRQQMERSQREYYLNEQAKAIQKELSQKEDEFGDIEKKIQQLSLSDEAREKAESELAKLKTMPAMSAESSVTRNYLDWLLKLPWGVTSSLNTNLSRAAKILESANEGYINTLKRPFKLNI